MRTFRPLVTIAIALMSVAWGQARADLTAPTGANAKVLTAIIIDKADDLDFGNLFAGGTPGTVTVPPNTLPPHRTKTGGVTFGPDASEGPAIFHVTGEPDRHYGITLSNLPTTLDHGSDHMTVGSFLTIPSGTGLLGADGTQVLGVGATLTVGAGQNPGVYNSTPFDVTVAYE